MYIQAMRMLAVNAGPQQKQCSLSLSQSFAIAYSVGGPSMTTISAGVVELVFKQGTVDPGSCVSLSLPGAPPYSVSVGQKGGALGATAVASSADAVVTYGYIGGAQPQLGAFVIVRTS